MGAITDWLATDTGFTHLQTLLIAFGWMGCGYIAGKRA